MVDKPEEADWGILCVYAMLLSMLDFILCAVEEASSQVCFRKISLVAAWTEYKTRLEEGRAIWWLWHKSRQGMKRVWAKAELVEGAKEEWIWLFKEVESTNLEMHMTRGGGVQVEKRTELNDKFQSCVTVVGRQH